MNSTSRLTTKDFSITVCLRLIRNGGDYPIWGPERGPWHAGNAHPDLSDHGRRARKWCGLDHRWKILRYILTYIHTNMHAFQFETVPSRIQYTYTSTYIYMYIHLLEILLFLIVTLFTSRLSSGGSHGFIIGHITPEAQVECMYVYMNNMIQVLMVYVCVTGGRSHRTGRRWRWDRHRRWEEGYQCQPNLRRAGEAKSEMDCSATEGNERHTL